VEAAPKAWATAGELTSLGIAWLLVRGFPGLVEKPLDLFVQVGDLACFLFLGGDLSVTQELVDPFAPSRSRIVAVELADGHLTTASSGSHLPAEGAGGLVAPAGERA
jgi:hypothetical protein